MTTNATKRRCNGPTCIAILRRDNDDPDGLCGACRMAATERAILRLREQMAEREKATEPKYTRKGLIETLFRMQRHLGHVPRAIDCGHPWPAEETFRSHFGGWRQALVEAGLIEEYETPRQKISAILSEGPTTLADMAQRMDRERRTVGAAIKPMLADGSVVREGPAGRRGFLYRLTGEAS